MGKFTASIERQKVKIVSASGFCPYPSDEGLYLWTLQTPLYRGLTVAFEGPPTL